MVFVNSLTHTTVSTSTALVEAKRRNIPKPFKVCCKAKDEICIIDDIYEWGDPKTVTCQGKAISLKEQCDHECNHYPYDAFRNFVEERSYVNVCNESRYMIFFLIAADTYMTTKKLTHLNEKNFQNLTWDFEPVFDMSIGLAQNNIKYL